MRVAGEGELGMVREVVGERVGGIWYNGDGEVFGFRYNIDPPTGNKTACQALQITSGNLSYATCSTKKSFICRKLTPSETTPLNTPTHLLKGVFTPPSYLWIFLVGALIASSILIYVVCRAMGGKKSTTVELEKLPSATPLGSPRASVQNATNVT